MPLPHLARPLLLLLALLLSAVPIAGATPESEQTGALDPPEVRAIWVDAFHDGFKTRQQVDELVDWARSVNANALFVQVRRRGDAYYLRATEPRTEDPDLQPGFDALQYLIERAHGSPSRLEVHAWLATLAIWHRRDQPPLDSRHVFNRHGLDAEDTWLMLRDDGAAWAGSGSAGTYYLDPGHPAAARYTADAYIQVLREYDVDGIHLDHVRYYEGASDRRWGYNPTSVARFNAREGREPDHLPDPNDPAWMAWRRDQVTALVRQVYLRARAIKPRAVVSAAVIAWGDGPDNVGGWERTAPYRQVFQDWRYWVHEGIVDYLMPMNYYREAGPQASWFDAWSGWQQAMRGRRGVVVGLGGFLNAPDATLAQARRARALAPLGISLYSYAVPAVGGDDDPYGARDAVAPRLRDLFPRPAHTPELPWISRPITGGLLVDVPLREGVRVLVTGPERFEWRTDGAGIAGAVEVPPGRYTVQVLGMDVDPLPVEVVVQAGRTATVRYGAGLAIHPRYS